MEYQFVADKDYNFAYSPKNPERLCCVEGCGAIGQDVTPLHLKMQNRVRRRHLCMKHHRQLVASRHGVDNFTQVLAKNAGVSTAEYRRRSVRHRRYMKNYCENIDGRLGFKCTTTIILDCGMLHVDHINGISFDERPENYQTLCSCCHSYKSNVFKDYKSHGRKSEKYLSDNEKAEIIAEAEVRYAAAFAKFTANNNTSSSVSSSNNIEDFIKKCKKGRKLNKVHNYVKDDNVVTMVKW